MQHGHQRTGYVIGLQKTRDGHRRPLCLPGEPNCGQTKNLRLKHSRFFKYDCILNRRCLARASARGGGASGAMAPLGPSHTLSSLS